MGMLYNRELAKSMKSATDPSVAASLRRLYRDIQQSLRNADYEIVDALFRAADIPNLPPETLIALLRYSFTARGRLPNWDTLLSQVSAELDRRHLDAKRLLSGLKA
jgi:hypothetical protein